MTHCVACGQFIQNVVIIEGLPYGTTCALNKLGLREFPSWFRGEGDWSLMKAKHEAHMKVLAEGLRTQREVTSRAWPEWLAISRVHVKARRSGNDWLADFTWSIANQLGYHTVLPSNLVGFDNFEEAEKSREGMHDFPYIYQSPGSIESLSPKQLQILRKHM